jgi:hypothetical protein
MALALEAISTALENVEARSSKEKKKSMGDAARQVKIKVGVAKRYVYRLVDRCSSIRTGIMLNLISDVPPPFGLLARSI